MAISTHQRHRRGFSLSLSILLLPGGGLSPVKAGEPSDSASARVTISVTAWGEVRLKDDKPLVVVIDGPPFGVRFHTIEARVVHNAPIVVQALVSKPEGAAGVWTPVVRLPGTQNRGNQSGLLLAKPSLSEGTKIEIGVRTSGFSSSEKGRRTGTFEVGVVTNGLGQSALLNPEKSQLIIFITPAT